jgi:hypothetical protein
MSALTTQGLLPVELAGGVECLQRAQWVQLTLCGIDSIGKANVLGETAQQIERWVLDRIHRGHP